MLIDARFVDPATRLRTSVAVVGAGPIGCAVAFELAAAGIDVVVLESGGVTLDYSLQSLGDPNRIDFRKVRALNNTRQVGGNANAWQVRTGVSQRGVRLLPMIESDFSGRAGDPGSSWPFGREQLAPYYRRAQTFFGLPSGLESYEPSAWTNDEPPVAAPELRTGLFQFADGGRLVTRLRARLSEHTKIRTLHHATVAEVLTNQRAAAATGLRVRTAPGRDLVLDADYIVLAAGTVTTTQLLLSSTAVRPEGLGNRYDLVGRYFMDHLLLQGGHFFPTDGDLGRWSMYDLRVIDGTPIMGHLQLSDATIRDLGVSNVSMLLFPRDSMGAAGMSQRQASGREAALAIREAAIRRTLPKRPDVRRLLKGIDGAAIALVDALRNPVSSLGRGGWSRNAHALKRFDRFEVIHQAEQLPHRDNRITLSGGVDAFGIRRVDVRNRLTTSDVDGIQRAQDVFASALRRSGAGEFSIARTEDGDPVIRSASSNHFMGTTRMSRSALRGVVDEFGRVHGTKNIVVASSSVFPTGGFANVTLTALAVALRSVDALIKSLRPSVVAASTE